jgi:cytoskeletal protein CcmA (bactofilin family)
MANQIQIKRSTTTATPGSLANGELAFSSNGDVLFIGANGVVEPIGGKRTPGTLTANQALVANSTSGIDKVIVANLVPTSVWANGAAGTGGQILTSNSSGGVYWASPAATTAGANTQVQFNDEGALAGDADFTFNKTTNTLTVTNIAGNGAAITSVNASAVGGNTVADLNTYADNKAANAYSNAMSDTLSRSGSYTGNNTFGGTNTVITSNVTISGTINRAPTITLAGDLTGSVTLTDLANGTLTATIAADSVALGTDTTGNYVATITAGAGISGASSAEGGTPTIAVVANNGITANSSGVFVNGQDGLTTNSTGVFVKAGTGVTVNATGVHIGQAVGTTDNVTFNDITINGNTTIGSNSSDVVSVNGRINTALVPAANVTYDLGSTTMRWKDLYLSGSTLVLGNVTLSDASGSLSVNSASVGENLSVLGNAALGSNSSDIVSINGVVNTAITPSANITYDLGTNTSRWREIHAANVHSVDGYFDGNLQVSGNLVVLGDALTVNVATLAVEDSLIQLATNNTSTDLLDIGFYGNYQVGGGGHEHAGLFRDASDDGIFKIFYGLQDAPTTTIDIAGVGYTQGTIQAYLKSGALISNATHVAITANSTVNVAITANTLSLATALAATDGGTGFDTYTSGDLLVANTGNALSKLSLGTDGYVLQSNGTALIYSTLDGGSF